MTFLKRLGSVLARVISIATGIGPLVLPFIGSGKAAQIGGAVINDLTAIGQTIIQAEAMIQTPGSGAAKLAAASPLVASIIRTSQMLDGKKIANEALFIEGCQDITSGMAKVLNAIHPDEVKTV